METSESKNVILQLKHATFYEDSVSIRMGKFFCDLRIEDIDYIDYKKPSFFTCFMAATSRAYCAPGYLWILAKQKIRGSCLLPPIKIKFEEIFKLPDKFKKFLDILR